LITEGTYPFHDGGVSVWCDQLVRGMSAYEYEVQAVTTTGAEVSSWDLPANVDDVRSIPLWGPTIPRAAMRRLPAELHEVLRRLMFDITSPSHVADFQVRLRELLPWAQAGDLSPALLSEEAVALAIAAMGSHTPEHRSFDAPPPLPTIADAVASLKLLEHLLRPLGAPIPRVDLCHASSNGVGVLTAFSANWQHGTPFLLTEHGLYLRERYIAYSPLTLPHHQRAFVLGFFKQLTAAAYQVAEVIAPGSEYNRYWELANGAAAHKIIPIYNGIDAPSFAPAEREPDQPTIVWVGRIDPLKDVKTILRAFAYVRTAMPEARLRVFGGTPVGNASYMKECQELHDRLGLGDSATFEGRIPSIIDAYHSGHIVVSTSISEGFPYSVLEAMASGRAMVATDVGGVGEAIADVGYLVPPRNPRAVADACLELLKDPMRRAELAIRGRQRVLERFTVDVCIATYAEIYADLINRNRSSAQRSDNREPSLDEFAVAIGKCA
jgi:glycosyltransferase involved in cell wall biosynthesis